MPSVLTIGAGPRTQASDRRGAPRKLLRGRTRTTVRRSIAMLTGLQNIDTREQRRATELKYEPFLLFGKENSRDRNALSNLLKRLRDLMDAKVGDE